jgi:REP element-mobilizing transposase RayT
MEKQSELRHGRYVVFNLHVHLVFVTKYLRNVFDKTILDDLQLIFSRSVQISRLNSSNSTAKKIMFICL